MAEIAALLTTIFLAKPKIAKSPGVTDATAPAPQPAKNQELLQPEASQAQLALDKESLLGTRQLEIPLYQPLNAP